MKAVNQSIGKWCLLVSPFLNGMNSDGFSFIAFTFSIAMYVVISVSLFCKALTGVLVKALMYHLQIQCNPLTVTALSLTFTDIDIIPDSLICLCPYYNQKNPIISTFFRGPPLY